MRGLERTGLRTLAEVAPPGFKGTVRAMKSHGHTGKGKDKIDNPYALAWYMKKKGDKPHYKDQKSSKKGKPVKFKKYRDEDKKEETVSSIFDDIIQEGSLPPALERFKLGKKGKKDDSDDDKPDFLKKKDDEMDGCHEQSIFDDIVQESSSKSVFDDIVESNSGSLFDGLLAESKEQNTEANWEDRVARTMTLAEDLVSIRSSYK